MCVRLSLHVCVEGGVADVMFGLCTVSLVQKGVCANKSTSTCMTEYGDGLNDVDIHIRSRHLVCVASIWSQEHCQFVLLLSGSYLPSLFRHIDVSFLRHLDMCEDVCMHAGN